MSWILEDSSHSTVSGNHFPIIKQISFEMFFVAELASTYSRDFSQETLYYLIGKDR